MATIYRISVKNLNAGVMNRIFNNYHKYNLNKNSRILLLAIISQNVYILKRVHREYFMESAGVRYLRTSC